MPRNKSENYYYGNVDINFYAGSDAEAKKVLNSIKAMIKKATKSHCQIIEMGETGSKLKSIPYRQILPKQ